MNGPNQNQRRRPPAQQSPSSLLSDQENARLFGMLGKKCISLATGVVQVYLAQGNGMKWQKRCTGVCCFIKDNPKRSYFIRVYSIRNESQLWEQELFNQFKYNAPRPYFHTFDTDQCRAGLNFANEQEAMKFQQVIEDKIRNRQDKRAVQHQQHHAPPTPSQAPQHTVQMQAPTPSIDKKKSKTKKDKKKGKLSKADIGTPQDFKHVGHVGWDPNKGFDMNNMDPDVKNLFAKAGIKDSDLQDKEKAQFIYKFIEDQGGMEAIKEDIKRVSGPPPAPPTRGGPGGPPPPPRRNDGPPPPPPSRQNAGGPPPPPPQRRQPSSQPPPPPSSRGHRGGPPPPQRSEPPPFRGMDSMPPPPPQGGVPPPPPMGSIPPPPPAPTSGSMPPPPPSGGGGGGGRGALLSSIRQGTGLKPPGERAVGGGGGGGGGGGRGALLDQIRLGAALKKPGASDAGSEPAPPAPQEEGLAGALARALQKRETAIQSGSDSDYSGGESDEEWSD